MQQITTVEIPNSSVLRYQLDGQGSNFGSTNSNISKEHKNSLAPALNLLTEEEAGLSTAKIFKFPTEIPQKKVAPVVTKDYVEGVVISHDEISVCCELIVNDKAVEIQLPRSLFPKNTYYGLPINLQMVDDGGIRRPLVVIRKIDEKRNADIADEFDLILNAL